MSTQRPSWPIAKILTWLALCAGLALHATNALAQLYLLTATRSGAGTVTSTPAGIDCGATCSVSFASGTSVTLTALPSSGYAFTGWSGACTGTVTCTLMMDAAKSVTATITVSGDTQAPSVPMGLAATAVSSPQINLSWSGSTDNVGVTQYKIYRTIYNSCVPTAGMVCALWYSSTSLLATLSGAPPATSYSDTGLLSSARYDYTVQACDAAGNCSDPSAPASATTLAARQYVFEPKLEQGFNLISNALNVTLDVAALFGNQDAPTELTPSIVSIWKWNAVQARWAFNSPQFTAAANAAYAAAHNYEVLSVINLGEGYWVNSIVPLTLPPQSGTGINWTGFDFAALPSGFNLITTADGYTPSEFNVQVSEPASAQGVIPTTNFVSLWAWDAVARTWYFYSPLLEAAGGLPAVKAHADSNFYRHFQDYGKILGIGTGFWVNRP